MEFLRVLDPLFLAELARRNKAKHDTGYNSAKLAEECAELSLVLQQAKLKPTKVKLSEITDEVGDVYLRLTMFMLANPDIQEEVSKRIADKQNIYHEWLKNDRYDLI